MELTKKQLQQKKWNKTHYDKVKNTEKFKKSSRKNHVEYYQKNKDRHNEHCRQYEKRTGTKKRYYIKNKDKIIERQVKYQIKKYREDPEFRRKVLLRNKSQGLCVDISDKPCTVCGSKENQQRHHPSYESTDFIILCRDCHTDLHNEIRAEERKHLLY